MQVIEENTKLALVEVELNELRLKQSQTTEMEKKIPELENTLHLARTSAEEVSLTKVKFLPLDGKDL